VVGAPDKRGKGRAALDPTALSPTDMARMLSAAGGRRITAEMVAADVAAGAPVNRNGTLNLVHYTAWLARETP